MRLGVRTLAVVGVAAATTIIGAPAASASAVPVPSETRLEVVATGLDNPRHLNLAPGGRILVAEAGRGGDTCAVIPGPEGEEELCIGATGAVTELRRGGQERVLTGLPSIAPPDGFGVLAGPHDVLGRGGDLTVALGLGGAERYPVFGDQAALLGSLVEADDDGDGPVEVVADLLAYEVAADPDGNGADSNPYGLSPAGGGKVAVADAGGNDLLLVDHGEISTLAVFPSPGTAPLPPFIPAPPGTVVPYESVPTSVDRALDGSFRVGELTGFPFPVDEANVYSVPRRGGDPSVAATGFSSVIDVAVGLQGELYVLELAEGGVLALEGGASPGVLYRVDPDGTRTELAREGLVAPGGVAVSASGEIYVTNYSVFPGAGQVLRVVPPDQQRPTSFRADLTADLTGAAEVPGPGDPDGTGSAVLTVDAGEGVICYGLTASGIEPATAAHIHEGAPDEAGPVVQGLLPPTEGASEGCVRNRRLAVDLVLEPEEYYVNVHNGAYPNGAVRGQLAES